MSYVELVSLYEGKVWLLRGNDIGGMRNTGMVYRAACAE